MTEKKIRKHLQRIWFHFVRLENALNQAHYQDVIKYEGYTGVAPCECMTELKARIEDTTKDQLAQAVHREHRQSVRGGY